MTSLKVAGFVALVLFSLPATVSAAEFEHQEDRQVDAVHAQGGVYAALVEGGQSSEGEHMRLDAAYMASLVPADSQMADFMAFLLTLRPAPAPAAPQDAPALPDVDSEAEALFDEGVVAQGETHASEDEVQTSAVVRAGSQSQGAEAAARPADALGAPEEPADDGSNGAASAEGSPEAEGEGRDEAQKEVPVDALAASDASAVIEPISLPVALAATAVVLGTSASAAVVVVPGWRSALVRLVKRFGWLVLFSRIAQEDILNHERRSELLEFIRNNPGERVEVARRALGFSNGSMHYHLRVLQDRELVKILKEGSLARLYARGPKITPAPYVPAQRKRFVDALSQAPGKTQRELAAELGLSERMVSYHVRALAQQGLVEVRAEGARKRLFPAQAMAPLGVLAPAA